MDKRVRGTAIDVGLALVLAVVIFVVSSIPGRTIQQLDFDISDKLAHFLEFGIFGFFLYRAIGRFDRVRVPAVVSLAAGMAYGVLDEIHQAFVPGRMSDITDFAADTAGLLCFIGLAVLICSRRRLTPDADAGGG